MVSCTACVLCHRKVAEVEEEEEGKKEGRKVTEENLTTTTLTVGNKSISSFLDLDSGF